MLDCPLTEHRHNTGLAAVLAALALLAADGAAAQTDAATDSPQRQDMVCLRDEQPLTPVHFDQVAAQSYSADERACWVDWQQARQLAGQGAKWVDVRDSGAVQRMRLPGTLAVPSTQVATQAGLRGLNLLILGDDVDLRELSRQCVAWRQTGHFGDVRIVLGGVRAWRLAGRPALFDARATPLPTPPTVVTPAEYRRGLEGDLWRVVTLGIDPNQTVPLEQPVLIIPSADAGALEQVRQALTGHEQNADQATPTRPWLVVTADAASQERLQALWNQQQPASPAGAATAPAEQTQALATAPLLWLGGGLSGYQTWLAQQRQLAAHAGHALPRPCGV